MKPFDIRCLMVLVVSGLSFPCFSAGNSEYGDSIKDTPEYKEITTPNNGGDRIDRHYHYPHHYHFHDPYYRPAYRPPAAHYRSSGSGGVGYTGTFYLGVTIGESEFDYDDIEDGDASIFRFGYRPRDSRLSYELSFFNSGDANVTSLPGIDIDVDTVNLVLTINSARNREDRLNLFGQGGIYFADTVLTGPFDSVRESSNGFLLAVGAEIMLNRHFSLRAEAYNLLDVEDFADDKSISALNFGGSFIF